ncbi:MAG: hypothetical protein EAX96_11140 [Candidatus Lokiarchaeota archaeon]|nr:hypothetical protein [Candidatus Lokiarchaeota archaeon]
MKKIIILSGKGGVGKTTISCATALKIADIEKDANVLIVSFDIAHNLADVFGVDIGNNLTKLTDNLWGIEPDPDYYIDEYTRKTFALAKATIYDLVVTRLSPTLKSMIDMLLTKENIPMQAKQSAFFQIFLNADAEKYDYVIGDFPPSGGALNLFEVPVFFIDQLMKKFMTGATESAVKIAYEGVRRLLNPLKILDGRSPLGELLEEVKDIKKKGDTVHQMLKDYLSFRLVTIPEKASILETLDDIEIFEHYYSPDCLYINKIISDEVIQGNKFLEEKKKEQITRVEEVRERIKLKTFEIPLNSNEPINIEGLRKLATNIYGDASLNDILNPK